MSEVFPKAGSSRLEWLRQRPALLRCLPPNYDLKSSTIPCNQPPLPDSSAYPTDITLLSPSNFKVVSSCHTKSSLICIITNSFLFSALLHYESFLCIRRKLFSRCLFVPPPSFFFTASSIPDKHMDLSTTDFAGIAKKCRRHLTAGNADLLFRPRSSRDEGCTPDFSHPKMTGRRIVA